MSTTTTATPTPNHHQPVPHPILIPLIPLLALLGAFTLVVYLNREAFSCLRARSDGYVHADRDEGGRVYESRKMGKKKKQQGRTRGDKMARLGLRSRMKSRSDEDDGIEMRPLMRNGMENGTTSSSMIYKKEEEEEEASEQEHESESESESFFIPSDSSSLASSSNSGDDIPTDPLSLSKYFDPQTHVLLSKYRDPPSPVTDTWEIELRQRIREGGSVIAWVDYVVDCAAEWWEGMSM
ncbi:hypothetical protein DTO164E3_5873 [Paecilomyces variotii]|nr:hypothetical protein DTO032I3_6419 [Paecilomyces variotii]KAJ9197159.1 hypothetical protein DTO164E3_5873 [Paecilomyces variotii]KAJ9219646.1 hypothetical protein DTO169C6_8020 [Paecilomyces variotii]KAJ9275076.1 hypothetical protein DTO021D3_8051 [Paecilomyces variotii]KAJ9313086.1 hypothetical protein DTO271D3_6688 [Paecilomyces variotii]